MSGREPLIFIIAGEPSGDNLAGRLIGALREMTGNRVRIVGIGGPQSEAQGLKSLFPMRELALIGIAEVLPHLPRLVKRINQTAATIREMKPDIVVTVDAPSFTLRVASKLRGSGIPIVHYVAPQAWAWRAGRAKTLGKRVDHLMALLPFEVPFFAEHGLPTDYVGHPAIESALAGDGKSFREAHGIADTAPLREPSKGRVSRRVRSFPITPRVTLRPDEKGQRWLLNITASDRVGLLYAVARVLARHQINLQLAKIATLGERVDDTFLIDGAQLQYNRDQIAVETELLRTLA